MSQSMISESLSNTESIRDQYQELKSKGKMVRARNAADEIGISEGELIAAHVGENVTRLVDDPISILKNVSSLGEVMALTRNEHCVHERHGVYENDKFFTHGKMSMGLFANPDIDLRLFMNHWKYNFSVIEKTKTDARKSLQFFDKEGRAIHKIYLTKKSDEQAFDNLVAEHLHENQETYIDTERYDKKPNDKPDHEIDWSGFRVAWENLKDTHDFFPMLSKFGVGREQAFKNIGSDFAYQVDNQSTRDALMQARDTHCEIMVFVGNRGCIQIHTGEVNKLVEHGDWYNVLDPLFNLHLREDEISTSWVTKKPTEDGIVTALEIFDKDGEIIVTFFGKRKPGIPELDLWREIVENLIKKENSHAA
jgi:putative hemin transport protein